MFQVYLFQNQIRMIPQAVILLCSKTRVLHFPMSEEYALTLQLHIFHIDYLAQLGLFLVEIRDIVLDSTCSSDRALHGPVYNKEIPTILFTVMLEVIGLHLRPTCS